MKAEEGSGITARHAMSISLSRLDAIQDCAPVVEKGTLTNGHQCLRTD